jgi:hypothetical protein
VIAISLAFVVVLAVNVLRLAARHLRTGR